MFFNKDGFIIKSTPKRIKIDNNSLATVANHINNGYNDGFTQEEIIILLDWTVENTRQNIEKYTGVDITRDDLMGLCGFAQASSLLPFETIFRETYNSTIDFKYVLEELKHAFGTIIFPLKEEKKIIQKQYLVDVTYRQFFKKIMCQNPTYEKDGTFEMDPGFFLCNKTKKTKESLRFSKQLLQKGYIELTDYNLKLYIDSFILSSIYRINTQSVDIIKKLNIEFYREHIKKPKPYEQEFDEDSLLRNGCTTRMPNIKYKKLR